VCVVQQPKSLLGRLTVEVSTSRTIRSTRVHTHTHTRALGLLWTRNQVVAAAATYTTHNKYEWRTSMRSVWFEPAIPELKWVQAYSLDRTANTHFTVFK